MSFRLEKPLIYKDNNLSKSKKIYLKDEKLLQNIFMGVFRGIGGGI